MIDTSAALPAKMPTLFNILLWAAQAFVGITFTVMACIKIFKPIPELAAMWPWTGEYPVAMVRGLGLIDLAGGIGILMPSLTRIKPNLAVAAALGCFLLQICASIFHISRGEMEAIPVNGIYLVLTAFIFWGRRKYPVLPNG